MHNLNLTHQFSRVTTKQLRYETKFYIGICFSYETTNVMNCIHINYIYSRIFQHIYVNILKFGLIR